MVRDLPRLLKGRPPSEAIPYRIAVGAVVWISVLATVLQSAVTGAVGVLALVLIPAGFVFSYLRRNERNVLLKIGLALALFAAFGGFIDGVRGAVSLDQTRAPLTALFLWVQVLHSFDVPRRRDLSFSVAASAALIALAGSLSFSTGFVVLVLLYAVCFMAALVTGHLSDLHERAGTAEAEPVSVTETPDAPPAGRSVARPLVATAAATLACALVVFVALPRLPGARAISLPFSLAQGFSIPGFSGEVVQPDGLESRAGGDGGTTSSGRAFDPDAYFGYGERLDLRVRGTLSNELVLRVRSPEPHLWWAQAYDTYLDGEWRSSDEELTDLGADLDNRIDVPRPLESQIDPPSHELIQTFYVERDLPNLVFGARRIEEIYTPSTSAKVDDFGSIRLPFILEEDTIYSVISEIPEADTEDLRFVDANLEGEPLFERYLQLPDSLGPRFHDLARDITRDEPTSVDKVLAVQEWLRENKEYRLDIPRDPAGVDPVEVFLFERSEGFCEQIATSMALLLRSVGIPTRLATGFGEGERNLFTGYWEVRNSDAHAWVEVYYPGYGWIPYDPTFGVPASDASNSTFVFAPIARFASDVIPTKAIGQALGAVGRVAGPAGTAGLALLGVGVLVGLVTLVRRRRRPAPAWRPTDDPRDRVVAAWLEVEAALAEHGLVRRPHETARDLVVRASGVPNVDARALRALLDRFDEARYGPGRPTDEDASEAHRLAGEIGAVLAADEAPAFALRR